MQKKFLLLCLYNAVQYYEYMRHMSGLSSNYLYIDRWSISRKKSLHLQILYYRLCSKMERALCNDLSSMTVRVTVRLLKGNCCQVLQSTKKNQCICIELLRRAYKSFIYYININMYVYICIYKV